MVNPLVVRQVHTTEDGNTDRALCIAGAHAPGTCAQVGRALALNPRALLGRSRVKKQELALLEQVSPPLSLVQCLHEERS